MGRKLTTNEFIEKSKKIHGMKYDYSKSAYGKTIEDNVIIICPIHGEFSQCPSLHLYRKHGCPKCGIEKQSNSKRDTLEWFIERAIKIHGNLYDYSKCVYTKNFEKMEIVCKKHGTFLQSSVCHIYQTQGCPKCNFSKAELKITKFLEKNNIDYIPQKTFSDCINPKTNQKLKFDFYIQSKNLLIEYDGPQHFKIGCRTGGYTNNTDDLFSIQFRDKIKTEYTMNVGINLLRIKYTKFKKIDKILADAMSA